MESSKSAVLKNLQAAPVDSAGKLPAPALRPQIGELLRSGIVIPAHPLALTDERRLDERRQRALTRYYHAAGAQGVAVGVHTTQFEIREPKHGLLQPVLELAAETIADCDRETGRSSVLIAGVCGPTPQAVAEAQLARELGYQIGMLSLGAMPQASDDQLIAHCAAVASELPIFGFYMQTSVGGRELSIDFWRRLAEIPNLAGIKIAPFDRYKTIDVVRAIAESGRQNEVALYTGNDDAIVIDLLTQYETEVAGATVPLRIVGGLLGHWACWTQKAVEVLRQCQATWTTDQIPSSMLTLAAQVTDCNAALFDAKHRFQGCIPGVHYALQQQGLLANLHCLDPAITLSPGQQQEIDRVRAAYPHLIDDDFVRQHLDRWLA
ncbi:MAG: dihydrodipicolinate synthase family protein [Blastopirellula sp. JB062]